MRRNDHAGSDVLRLVRRAQSALQRERLGAMPATVTRSTVVTGEHIAGFWWRVLSFIIDSFIVNAAIGLLQSGATNVPTWALALEAVGVNAAYFGLWIRYKGWSPGMAMCHMRCRSVDGSPVTSKQIFTRTLFYCVWILLPFLHPLRFYIDSTTHHVTIPTQGIYIFLLLQVPHYFELLWAAWDQASSDPARQGGGYRRRA